MADEHTHGHEAHGHEGGPSFQLYLYIFAALSVFTALSFIVNWTLGQNATSAMVILVIAVIKAILVAAIFMHLKFDWGKLYFMVFPVLILAVVMMLVLLPDIVLAWHH